jgi:hypothetical protein
MPWNQVMKKFGKGALHSGSKTGKVVNNRQQAIAIMMSEKKKAGEGKQEYQPVDTGPSSKLKKKRGL